MCSELIPETHGQVPLFNKAAKESCCNSQYIKAVIFLIPEDANSSLLFQILRLLCTDESLAFLYYVCHGVDVFEKVFVIKMNFAILTRFFFFNVFF